MYTLALNVFVAHLLVGLIWGAWHLPYLRVITPYTMENLATLVPRFLLNGARLGAVAGGITGVLTLVGQLLGGVGMLVLFQRSGLSLPFGTIPDPSADVSRQLMYYISGLGVGTCFGLTGVVLAALGGAGASYLGTPTSLPTDLRSAFSRTRVPSRSIPH